MMNSCHKESLISIYLYILNLQKGPQVHSQSPDMDYTLTSSLLFCFISWFISVSFPFSFQLVPIDKYKKEILEFSTFQEWKILWKSDFDPWLIYVSFYALWNVLSTKLSTVIISLWFHMARTGIHTLIFSVTFEVYYGWNKVEHLGHLG